LSAALSPTDPIAVTAIASRLGAPRRVLAVLKGENLINDGTALVFYSAAVEAVVSGHFSWRAITLEFPATVCGGIAIDRAFGSLVHVMGAPARLGSGYHITVLVFLCAYLTYLSAELLHVSGVLAAVSSGIYIGRRASFDASPTDRIMVYSFLEIMVFLINVIVFILLGLQFPGILARITDLPTPTLVFWASFVSLAVIALHLAWAMIFGQLNFPSVTRPACTLSKPPWRQSGVIGGAGMRGAVSLAPRWRFRQSSPVEPPFQNAISSSFWSQQRSFWP
jgi:monovalent cation/hydrogen antiporter